MSKTGSSQVGTNKASHLGSQHIREEGEDYEMISKVDSNAALLRRNSVFDQNPHYKKSLINSLLKTNEHN